MLQPDVAPHELLNASTPGPWRGTDATTDPNAAADGEPSTPAKAESSWRGRVMVVVLLGLFTVIHSSFLWPGRMSPDTIAQIEAVRTGQYSDWHAPLLILLWRPWWLLGVGPGWVTTASTMTYLVGLYGILRSMVRRRTALIATFVTVLFPPVLGYLGYLGRDLWYVAFFLLAVACMARLASTRRRLWRRLLLAAVITGLWLMCAARQNAFPGAGVVLVALLSSCGPWPALRRFDRTTGTSGTTMAGRVARVAVAATALLCLLGTQGLVRRAFQVEVTHPEQVLFLYDVAGVSLRLEENQFSPEVHPSQDLSSIERNWDPRWVNSLLFNRDPTFAFPLSDKAAQAVRDDWLRTIRNHPMEYLKVRWALWERQIALHTPAWWIYQPGVSPNPWGYQTANPRLDAPLQHYLRAGVVNDVNGGGDLYKLWLYLAITVAGILHLRQRDVGRQLLGWCCLASLVYQATVFIGAMGTDYRMVYPSVVLATVIVVVAVVDLGARLTRRGV